MIQLTAEERLIWRVLRDRARSADLADPETACLHYVDLGKLIDPAGRWRYPMSRPPFRGLNTALGHVSKYELEHGRPLLSALVTTVDTEQPGEGFAVFARELGIEVGNPAEFWRAEVGRVVMFWSGSDDLLVLEASLDKIMGELAALRELLRERVADSTPVRK